MKIRRRLHCQRLRHFGYKMNKLTEKIIEIQTKLTGVVILNVQQD